MELPEYLHRLRRSELDLAESHRRVALSHADDPGSMALFLALARQNLNHAQALVPLLTRYGNGRSGDVHGLLSEGGPARGRTDEAPWRLDLQDLYLSACLVDLAWAVLMQAAQGMRDRDLVRVVEHCSGESGKQLAWIKNRIKLRSASTLFSPPATAARAPDS